MATEPNIISPNITTSEEHLEPWGENLSFNVAFKLYFLNVDFQTGYLELMNVCCM